MKPFDPRLLKEATATKFHIIGLVAVASVSVFCTVVIAWYLSVFITDVFVEGGSMSEAAGNLLPIALAGLTKALIVWIQEVLSVKTAVRVKSALRRKLVSEFNEVSKSTALSTAEYSQMFTRGMDALESYFSRYLPQLFFTLLGTIGLSIVIGVTDLLSGAILLVTLPLIPAFMILIGLVTKSAQARQQEVLTRLAHHFTEALRGIATLRIFNRTEAQVETLKNVGEEYRRRTMKVLRLSFLSGFALELGASLSVALVAVTIGFRLVSNDLDLLTGLFVLLLAPEVFMPLRQLGVQYHAATEGIEATAKAFDLIYGAKSTQSELLTADYGLVSEVLTEIRNSSGGVYRLNGPSGSGKTQTLREIYARLGLAGIIYSPQRPQLISGSVLRNIIGPIDFDIGRIDRARLQRAIEVSSLDELDLEADVGEIQKSLSGGQIQRVALARAIYKALNSEGAAVLLDEPWSSVDRNRSDEIAKQVKKLSLEGYRFVIVSHQDSIWEAPDRSWVVNFA